MNGRERPCALDPALAAAGMAGTASHQLRELIRGLHGRGLEVLVHVVVTHLGEGTDKTPLSSSIRGIDPFSYYQTRHDGTIEEAGSRARVLHNRVHPAALDSPVCYHLPRHPTLSRKKNVNKQQTFFSRTFFFFFFYPRCLSLA